MLVNDAIGHMNSEVNLSGGRRLEEDATGESINAKWQCEPTSDEVRTTTTTTTATSSTHTYERIAITAAAPLKIVSLHHVHILPCRYFDHNGCRWGGNIFYKAGYSYSIRPRTVLYVQALSRRA